MMEAGIVTVLRDARNEIPYAAAVEGVAAGPEGDPPAQDPVPEQPFVPAVLASTPTVWETGLQMIRNTITKYGNEIMQRNTLMTGMPSTNYDSWRTWGLRLKEQPKRCKWGADYTWEVAALVAIVTPG